MGPPARCGHIAICAMLSDRPQRHSRYVIASQSISRNLYLTFIELQELDIQIVHRSSLVDCGLFCSSVVPTNSAKSEHHTLFDYSERECLTQRTAGFPALRHAEWGAPNLDPMEGPWTPPAPRLAQHFLTSGIRSGQQSEGENLSPHPYPGARRQAQGFSHWPARKSLNSLAPDSKAQLREFGSALRLIV